MNNPLIPNDNNPVLSDETKIIPQQKPENESPRAHARGIFFCATRLSSIALQFIRDFIIAVFLRAQNKFTKLKIAFGLFLLLIVASAFYKYPLIHTGKNKKIISIEQTQTQNLPGDYKEAGSINTIVYNKMEAFIKLDGNKKLIVSESIHPNSSIDDGKRRFEHKLNNSLYADDQYVYFFDRETGKIFRINKSNSQTDDIDLKAKGEKLTFAETELESIGSKWLMINAHFTDEKDNYKLKTYFINKRDFSIQPTEQFSKCNPNYCGGSEYITNINDDEIIVSQMSGDACWSAGNIYKFNILTDKINLITRVSSGCSDDGPQFLGAYNKKLYLAAHKWNEDFSESIFDNIKTYNLLTEKTETFLEKKDLPKNTTNLLLLTEEKSIFMGSNTQQNSTADDATFLYNLDNQTLTQQVPQIDIIQRESDRLTKQANDKYANLQNQSKNYLIIEEQPTYLYPLQSVTSTRAYNDYGTLIEGVTQDYYRVEILWADALKTFSNMPQHDQDPNGYYVFKLGNDVPYLSEDKQYIYFKFMYHPDLKAQQQTFSGLGKGMIDTKTGKVYVLDETNAPTPQKNY